MERENFPQYYTILFNGIADALKALDQQETSRAWDILVRIQQLRMPISARRRHK